MTVTRTGVERMREFASDDPLAPGSVVRLDGRFWLIASIEPSEDAPARALAEPARYRLRLRHPAGREESEPSGASGPTHRGSATR